MAKKIMINRVFVEAVSQSMFAFQPEPRHLEKAVYDSTREKLILFGGVELIKDGFIEPDFVTEWDGIRWKKFNARGPLGRRGHAMIYNKSTALTLLFGSVTQTKSKTDSLLFDAWEWNGCQHFLCNAATACSAFHSWITN